jgi:serine protease Do
MKSRTPLAFGAGAVLTGFFLGACVTQNQSAKDTLQSPAVAQTNNNRGTTPIRNADDLAALSSTYAQIAKKVTPAVVNIQAVSVQRGRVFRDPFSEFFGNEEFGGRRFREPDRRSQSVGSGVIISSDGLIITNNHVINGATSLTVTLNDRRRFTAKLLGADAASDVAVLKVDATNLPTLKWADSEKINVGDIVLAVGSPFNLSATVTQGIISAKGRRDLGISSYEDFIQTDAAINPGNSGGALVDIHGNLVGINTAILSESGGNQGIGLAIPANLAKSLGSQLAQTGKVTRGWLGVVVEALPPEIGSQVGLNNGVLVTGVYTNSPAGPVGWSERGTDVIVAVNDQNIESPGQLRNLVAGLTPGSNIKLRIWQDGKTKEVTLKAGNKPARAQGL